MQTEQARPNVEVTTSVGQNGRVRTVTIPDGNGGVTSIVVDRSGVSVDGQMIAPAPNVTSTAPSRDRDIPPGVMEIIKTGSTGLVLIAIGIPLIRVLGRWLDRRGAAPASTPEVLRRLAAIETAVETVAVEIERVTEGQRFTTKLLADRAAEGVRSPVRDAVQDLRVER